MASIIELIGESTESWEDAVNQAVEAASKTVQHITGVEVLNLTAVVENGRVSRYKADVHVAFGVDDSLRLHKARDMAAETAPV
ncbi:MAG: dodecin domain-containing protein [Firmicutes bacterium]|nr:dodecin domain-containing protein [Bacillota bacterium]